MKIEVGEHYLAFVLDEASRNRLLTFYPPQHEVEKCHHVTIAYEIKEEHLPYYRALVANAPPFWTSTYIRADGIDLFAVLVNGMTRRFDQKVYHITHSHSKAREASDANEVFRRVLNIHDTQYGVVQRLTGEFQLIPYSKK